MAHFAAMVDIIQNNRQRREHRERTKPFDMTPYLFRQRYGFSKEGVRRLVGIVGPVLAAERETRRGQPFTAEEIVCSGLHILRGGHFQRIEGECANTSQSSAFNNLYRFVDAINAVKPEYVHMPTDLEMARNMRWIEQKYGFPNVICGIDGTHCAFDGTPRGIPAGMDPVRFINRKGFNSLNVLVTGGFSGKIYDLVVTAPGSFHDAGIYHQSHVKAWLETKFPRRLCLGDSAFAISPVMIQTSRSRTTRTAFPAETPAKLHVPIFARGWSSDLTCNICSIKVFFPRFSGFFFPLKTIFNFAREQ